MKTKYVLLGLSALIAAGGVWIGRIAWRAHRQLVTLDVREIPLREVLRKIEWQTWKRIRAEKTLDARITLHVKDKPLQYVLDRISEQAGARWSRLYVVYDSARALRALESALQSDGKLEPAGWMKVAPKAPDFDGPDEGDAPVFQSGANPNGQGPIVVAPPQVAGGDPLPEGSAPMKARGGMLMRRAQKGGVMVSWNGNGKKEMWSAEELLMQSSLNGRLGTENDIAPTAEAAAKTARKVNGSWTTYVALRQSVMGVGFVTPGRGGPGLGPPRHDPNDRFAKLTPGQRVQRARERLKFAVTDESGGPKGVFWGMPLHTNDR